MSLSSNQAHQLAARKSGMTADETTDLLEALVSATLPVVEGAKVLRAWAERGETGIELASTVRFLRAHAERVPVSEPCFDLCGTGGSGLARFNVSTTVAFVAAAAGVPVAKHGNRGSSRSNGSFDLLEALNVPFELSPQNLGKLVRESGLCFLFARSHHPAVGKVVPYRKAAGTRSIFNLAGPLANPAAIKHQIIGTIDETTGRVVADALVELKSQGALVVWGEPGIDEISVTGKTGTLHVTESTVIPGEFNTPTHPGLNYSEIPAGDAEQNAVLFHQLLKGEETGPLLTMVCENAGAAIDLWAGRIPTYGGPGAKVARDLLASGAVAATFEKHQKLARKLS